MTSLLAELSASAAQAFAAEGLPETLGQVQPADRQDLAQFQCNGALAAAKLAKTNPRVLAEKIAARLKSSPLFSDVTIAGPGFINFKVHDHILESRLRPLAYAPASVLPQPGRNRCAIVDFGGPNVAKPMHVG